MLLLREKKAGTISQDIYNCEQDLITHNNLHCASKTPSLSPRHQSTPDWDYQKLDEEMESSSDIDIINGE
jgi:hypothetical protein